MKLSDLKDKKILILGFAREGKDTLLFLRNKFPGKKIGIADQKQGKHYLKKLKGYDVVIKSPGIPNWKIDPFLKKGQVITSQTDIFLSECPGTVIGITGTKGKSTTASLIHAMLKAGKVRSKLIGNIGEPVLKYLTRAKPKDVFVYELSSFQLENLRQSPHIAVLLNVYPEHLDHHKSFAKYVWAKANIAKHQTPKDFLIYDAENKITNNIAKLSKAQKLPYSPKLNLVKFADLTKLSFVAPTAPAVLVGKLFGISDTKIKNAIQEFKPLPHRLEYIGTYRNIRFVNDSLATIPQATVAALDAIGKQAATLIAGGHDRGISMKELAKRIENSGIQTLILFPDTGKKILRLLKKKQKNIFEVKNMKEAVRLAFAYTPKNKTCLLSPAASSFNMFKDYKERGETFTKLVKLYAKKKAS